MQLRIPPETILPDLLKGAPKSRLNDPLKYLWHLHPYWYVQSTLAAVLDISKSEKKELLWALS